MADASDRQSDLAVMEAEEYTQKRLLKRLIERRERVTELANEARQRFVAGQIDERGRDTMILYAVHDYVQAGYTLLLNHAEGTPAGEHSEYLFERELGDMQVGGESVEFSGLYSILATDEVYTRETTRVVEYPQGPPQTVTQTQSKAVPREISWKACRLMDEFLANEHGIELKVDQLDDSQRSFGFESATKDELDYDTFDEAFNGNADLRVIKELEEHAPA